MAYHGAQSEIGNSQKIVAKSKDGATVHYELIDEKNYAKIEQHPDGEGIKFTYRHRQDLDNEQYKVKVFAYTDTGDAGYIEISLLPLPTDGSNIAP
jgi:hypothetical protein